ncbi:hypothetical protein J1N35_016154 [Gossypium stocksii]|uniref:TF-B3 domain-containing protein n=1 Tax=Gossypium stocksii TaxID=47602 RepID=A0A9D3VYG0_9ROSI|nr:hypothetical protein J1N35_016154 [Gossypium stocksii]
MVSFSVDKVTEMALTVTCDDEPSNPFAELPNDGHLKANCGSRGSYKFKYSKKGARSMVFSGEGWYKFRKHVAGSTINIERLSATEFKFEV